MVAAAAAGPLRLHRAAALGLTTAAAAPAPAGPRSVRRLRRAPGRGEAARELAGEPVDRQALLGERVAVAHGHGAVLERPVVHGDAPGRADLVLAAVAAPDRAAVVVFRL